jgi:hypothetical protein
VHKSQGLTAQRRHDGQDAVYAGSTQSRQAVKAEQSASAKQHRNESPLNSIYFGLSSPKTPGAGPSAAWHKQSRAGAMPAFSYSQMVCQPAHAGRANCRPVPSTSPKVGFPLLVSGFFYGTATKECTVVGLL